MRRRWFEVLLGLAVMQPSPSAVAAKSNPPAKQQSTFYVNKPTTAIGGDGALAQRQRVLVETPRVATEKKLIFDASDTRRGLDDWQLEDYVLVATIEGSLYALDRHSGATKWVLEGGGPAVRSMGSQRPDSDTVNTTNDAWTNAEEQQPRWIVQPVEGGRLFLFDPEFGVLVSSISISQLTLRVCQ